MPIYVRLERETLARLKTRAEHEHRRPQDQAIVLIEEGLGLRGSTDEAAGAPARGRPEAPDGD